MSAEQERSRKRRINRHNKGHAPKRLKTEHPDGKSVVRQNGVSAVEGGKVGGELANRKNLKQQSSEQQLKAQSVTKKQSKKSKEDTKWREVRPKHRWHVSNPIGGRFLHVDPVFSQDEEHIILATAKAVQVYSAATSLLVRTLPVSGHGIISAYALSGIDPDQLYVASAEGSITLWNWMTGTQVGTWNTGSLTLGMAVSASRASARSLVYTLEQGKGQTWKIIVRIICGEGKATSMESNTLLTSSHQLRFFQVSPDGHYIVAATPDGLMVGNLSKDSTNSDKLRYDWGHVTFNEPITCVDIQCRSAEFQKLGTSRKRSSAKAQHEPLNLVVGTVRGRIYVYYDFATALQLGEEVRSKPVPSHTLSPQELHWHREAVGTVKWSLDGNYILSGGKETVLLLWQLDTGKRQDLPHLTSAIDCLALSPTGTSYAVQLADNSVIVLSTAELKPKTYIVGLQALIASTESPAAPQLPTVTDLMLASKNPLDAFKRSAAVVHPTRTTQICIAVPSSQPWTDRKDIPLPAPYLQTYDISRDRHVSRQALTRNNATNVNISPQFTKLLEPDVKLLQISHDGKWLATVEEWMPPRADVEYLAPNEFAVADEQRLRLEVYLKFWLWNAEEQVWMLETRIDQPHRSSDSLISGTILDLKADPVCNSFATIGDDGYVRIWRPKTRIRDGLIVRGGDGASLITWYARHSVELDRFAGALDADADIPVARLASNGCLAFSNDGSLVIACQEFPSGNSQHKMHFVSADAGEITTSKSGMYGSGLVSLAVVDRYLVILSSDLHVWDLVDFQLSYGLALNLGWMTFEQRQQMTHLATNPADNTFAISLPFLTPTADHATDHTINKKRKAMKNMDCHSEVIVFEPTYFQALSSSSFRHIITALLPASGSKGYVVLDSQAEAHVLTPKLGISLPQLAINANGGDKLSTQEVGKNDQPVIVDPEQDGTGRASPPARFEFELKTGLHDDDEFERPVVRPERLAEIFDVGPSHALPPVEDLFYAVADLFMGKPTAA